MSDSRQLAPQSRRLLAAILDLILLVIVTFVVLLVSGLIETAEAYRDEFGVTLRIVGAGTVAYLLLHGYLFGTRAQIVGKYVCRLVIVKTNSQKIAEPWRVLVRSVMKYVLLLNYRR